MLTKLSGKRQTGIFTLLCCLVYFISYLTRMNYAACLGELETSLDLPKSLVSLPVTACFISYGVGQLLCGFLGDRFAPRPMIFTGLLGASLSNLIICMFPRIEVIIVVWCLNGFFQSMLWPPLVRIMAEALTEDGYQKCCTQVSIASSVGTIFVYLMVPVCIGLSGWRTAFLLPALAGILVAAAWFLGIGRLQGEQSDGRKKDAPKQNRANNQNVSETADRNTVSETNRTNPCPGSGVPRIHFAALFLQASLLPILFGIILHGMMRDGITTWMPVYIMETFGLSSSLSILTAVVLPIFSIVSIMSASALLRKIKNELFGASILFAASGIFSLLLLFFFRSGPAVSISLMTLTAGCMYGINLYLISRVPAHFSGYGRVSSISGILNASTYIGSSLSAWLFGFLSERLGWEAVIGVWVILCLSGLIACSTVAIRWKRFCHT